MLSKATNSKRVKCKKYVYLEQIIQNVMHLLVIPWGVSFQYGWLLVHVYIILCIYFVLYVKSTINIQ